jgi:hypothetical protein
MTKLTVQRIKNLNTLVIKQTEGRFFIATPDSIIISVDSLASLLHFMVQNGLISRKVLEVILQDTEDEW